MSLVYSVGVSFYIEIDLLDEIEKIAKLENKKPSQVFNTLLKLGLGMYRN